MADTPDLLEVLERAINEAKAIRAAERAKRQQETAEPVDNATEAGAE